MKETAKWRGREKKHGRERVRERKKKESPTVYLGLVNGGEIFTFGFIWIGTFKRWIVD